MSFFAAKLRRIAQHSRARETGGHVATAVGTGILVGVERVAEESTVDALKAGIKDIKEIANIVKEKTTILLASVAKTLEDPIPSPLSKDFHFLDHSVQSIILRYSVTTPYDQIAPLIRHFHQAGSYADMDVITLSDGTEWQLEMLGAAPRGSCFQLTLGDGEREELENGLKGFIEDTEQTPYLMANRTATAQAALAYLRKRMYEDSLVMFYRTTYAPVTIKASMDGARADALMLSLMTLRNVVMGEIDENKHNTAVYHSFENKCMMQLMEDVGMRSIVIIRLNPDSFKDFQGVHVAAPPGSVR
ncbi:hypothetical protein HK097_001562 [Rhizophlyctis rosea]|uniref:Uncharacterized protein n=1 Tax=Rhizophlyctis rosea TaxID=64517 RepID=A0AAD5S4A0_9FUNG|nr:hypothetical protein HK097_001562 [Rhizophlyctis rosea]